MTYVIGVPPLPSVAVHGEATRRFPVRRIFCVGRNYAGHAREMGSDPEREPPFFFTKPSDAVVDAGCPVAYPPQTSELHHEVELVVALRSGGRDLDPNDALRHVYGYAVGNDLTRRDLQREAKARRRPWALAKGFDGAAVFGPLHPAVEVGHPQRGAISLWVDDEVRQQGDLSDMIWSPAEVIAHLSRSLTLGAGDCIMTGTPAGVGPLTPHQTCRARIEGLGEAATNLVVARS
ncbi:MAG: fumarylacetoacetate hydrolase family protein [Myxococcota bacterium]